MNDLARRRYVSCASFGLFNHKRVLLLMHDVQYASEEQMAEWRRYGFRISMARSGSHYDNATIESFFKTLKCEEVHLCGYETFADVPERIPYFVKEVYQWTTT